MWAPVIAHTQTCTHDTYRYIDTCTSVVSTCGDSVYYAIPVALNILNRSLDV